ncbi:type I polyketide synthase [Planctomyces sp. SH-PL62]|uniref:type I polyketide synthase n=1 Tax=Planctomyces sp. SH-PL62 TaxID=1636152 RepID=UPI00078C8913|nr:type I polyketide synthase [Planctomyces sp. SH-PL62]AMV36070.1 Phenolphthiocerol synthesis polyketide synthase type I Pks15/1 [Planctomyces sp. SH-PL62]
MKNTSDFDWMVLTPGGFPDPSLAIAGSRAGAVGVLNLEFVDEMDLALTALDRLATMGRDRLGVLLDAGATDLLRAILARPLAGLETIILAGADPGRLKPLVELIHDAGLKAFLIATGLEDAVAGQVAGVDAVIAKGNEAGGWVGDETTFVLLQRLIPRLNIPVWAYGGVGPRTAAACRVAGAAGAVLDGQLLLTRESPASDRLRDRVRVMDGSETICLGSGLGAGFRAYSRPDLPGAVELRRLEATALLAEQPAAAVRHAWRAAIRRRVDWRTPETSLLALGQDAAFAADLARKFGTVGGVLTGLRAAVREALATESETGPFAEGSPWARAHGTRFPIVQGPMTRVSDRAEFADAVAEAGGLPFLALALMRGPEARTLLEQTRSRLGDRPWGVGVLGFVPPELRAEQLEVVREYRPPFALIAGGRPDQSKALEDSGVTTYLHVPSPGLLRMFLKEGANRFVFEGRECGGHVGPRTSFVLWESLIEVLAEHLTPGVDASSHHVLFAGGVHDGLSAAMVGALAAPLIRRGVRVGVLLGTAYLFTREAVQTGAITESFQRAALACDRTVLLESGPGHATRCVSSPFVADFEGEKRRLLRQGLPSEELRQSLEELNIGRLRVASKGVDRNPRFGDDPAASRLVELDAEEQWARGMYMIGQVAGLRDGVCTLAELHEDVSAGGSRRLASSPRPAVAAGPPSPPPAAVAIVGMACILPGAPDLRTFWANIVNKVDAITEVPADRWDWRRYFDPSRSARDKIYSRWGGFIADVAFDPADFGMPPSSLRSIEPFQLLALAVVRSALEDAGYLNRPFPRERTSVILGAGGGGSDLTAGYMVRSCLPSLFNGEATAVTERLGDLLPEWTEDSFPGILMNVAAGRVANRFDLGGVNYTVDAACASSLAAVNLAVRDLEAGTSDVAIVGGVDAIQNPFAFLCFSKTQALSPNGRCRTFDAEGDGIAISEGFAAVILKRLDDAERDGDRVYAVIRGVGGSSDGRDRGLTAPRPEGQVRALRRAYAQAGYSPATVGLIEAHGTGTVAGDLAELKALGMFFGEAGATRQGCAVGSVKSMIGHTKATAGVAGLIKAALALNHRVLPPTLGVDRPNPKANFPESPFYVNTEPRPWIHAERAEPRRAGVSAFGFGGTNFHVALEEYTASFVADRGASRDPWPVELFVWRGRSRESLLEAVDRLAESLKSGARPDLGRLACTQARAAEAAEPGGPSLAIVASSVEDLAEKLDAARGLLRSDAARHHDSRGIHFADRPLASDGRIAFLFPGQGSQYVNMTRDLAVAFDEVRDCFERADRTLAAELGRPLSRWIFPPPAFGADEEKQLQMALTETQIAQPALAAADLAILRLLSNLGIEPEMAAGHSFGEFVALCAAGCYGERELLEIAAARGRFIRECTTEESGAMTAIVASPEELQPLLLADPGLTLANLNAPRQTVVAGTRAAVEKAMQWCQAHGLQARRLPVGCGFHSPLVAPAQRKLSERIRRLAIAAPRIPVYSNSTAATYPEDAAAVAELLADHLIRPVEFVRQIEAMYDAGARLFVEVGPRQVLSGLVGQILGDRPHVVASFDRPGVDGLGPLLHGLAALAAEGVPIRGDGLFQGRSTRPVDVSKPTERAEPSPTAWLVNGGSARPVRRKPVEAGTPSPPSPPPRSSAIDESFVVRRSSLHPARPGGNGHHPREVLPEAPPSGTPRQVRSPSRHDVLNGKDVIRDGSGGRARLPIHRGPADEGGSMTRSTVQSPRSNGEAPPPSHAEAVAPRDFPASSPPQAPPAPDGHGSADVARQFQQVMMRFLQTQETVMHDLLVYLGSQGPPAKAQAGRTHSHDEPNGEASAFLEGAAPASSPAVFRSLLDEVATTPAPSWPPADRAVSARPYEPASPKAPAGPEEGWREPSPNGGENGATARSIAAVPAAEAPSDRRRITERLLSIVGERTGYPEEMLSLDADLEADLGIDSIKRVEIAGTLVNSLTLPQGRSPDIESLTASRTLRQVVDHLTAFLDGDDGGGGNGDGERRAAEEDHRPFDGARTGHGVGRFALKSALAPSIGATADLAPGGLVVIVDDETGVGRRLAGLLNDRGRDVVRIVSEAGARVNDPDAVTAELRRPEEAARLVDELHARRGPVAALIHLGALRVDGAGSRRGDALTSLYLLCRALGPDLERAAAHGGAAILAATRLGGSFAVERPAPHDSPEAAGLAGFLKSLGHECPAVRIKAVDLPPAGPDVVADWLLDELTADDQLVEVGYRDGIRTILELSPAPLPAGAADLPLDGDSVVLVTGGARGITAEAALALMTAAPCTLVVVGRTPPPSGPEPVETAGIKEPRELGRAILEQLRASGNPVALATVEERRRRLLLEREVRENLERLRRTGARVEYATCDVRDAEAFGSLLDDVYRAHGRIDGVIHGAGVIEDRLVKDKTLESFERVVGTKAGAARILAERIRFDSLRFLVFFSSVSGRFGNRGQADYAAASEMLNKLAQDLDRRCPGRVVSINWGPWLGSGMVSPEVRRQFAERGVVLIPSEVGCELLLDELRHGRKGDVEILIGGAGGFESSGPPRATASVEAASTSRPLLRAAGVLSHGEDLVELRRPIDVKVDHYLQDHRLDGRPVFPFAMAMELMAEVASAGWPSLDLLAIGDIRLHRGVVLREDREDVRVVARTRTRPAGEAKGRRDEHPTARDLEVAILSAGDPRRVHYQASVRLGRRAEVGAAGHVADPRLLEGGGLKSMGVEEAYRDWLFHGPLFQGIASIEAIGPGGAGDPPPLLGPRLPARRRRRGMADRSDPGGQRPPDAGPLGEAPLGRDPAPRADRGIPAPRPGVAARRPGRPAAARRRSVMSCGSGPRARPRPATPTTIFRAPTVGSWGC